jgi:hypothetical protein
MKQVKTISQLKKICEDGEVHEFFIILAGGFVRSSKDIAYIKKEDTFYITNCVDDTEQELSTMGIMDERETMIGEAITKGAFYAY